MKANLKTSVSLFFGKGNWVEKVFMILLASISLAVFTLASMKFTHTQLEYLVVDYRNILSTNPYLIFHVYNDEEGISKYRDIIRTEMEDDYFSAISGLDLDPLRFITANFQTGEEYVEFQTKYFSELNKRCILCGKEDMYREMGYPLLAGQYPKTEAETVISKTYYDAFCEFGYSDNSLHYKDNGRGEIFLQFDSKIECAERESISSYEDVMGKKLAGTNCKELFEFTITGVFDDTLEKERLLSYDPLSRGILYPGYAFMLLSDKFEESYCKDEYDFYEPGPCVNYLFKPVTKDMRKRSYIKKAILLSERLQGLMEEERGENVLPGSIGLYGYYFDHSDYSFLNMLSRTNEFRVKFYLMVGMVAIILAIVINVCLVTDMMYKKRRQIAMLRALGYKKEKVMKIVMMSVLIMAFMVFFVSLTLTSAIYYGWFRKIATNLYCTLFIFNIWSVVILFVSSFLLTTLSAIVPILLFFRKPIAENLKRRE